MYKYREDGEKLLKKVGNPYKSNYKSNVELRNKIYAGMKRALSLCDLVEQDVKNRENRDVTAKELLDNLYMNVRMLESGIGLDSEVYKETDSGEKKLTLKSATSHLEDIREEVLDLFFMVYHNDDLPVELSDENRERFENLENSRVKNNA